MIVRASNAVIYGRENARAPPQSKSAVNSGEFSGLRCFYNSENTHSHGESAVWLAGRLVTSLPPAPPLPLMKIRLQAPLCAIVHGSGAEFLRTSLLPRDRSQ